MKSSPPLKDDLIFLFTDGEEAGLLGAKAFVDEHPWAKDVRLVLNFDARGNSGSAIMFETSNQNGALIRGFARSAPYPVTTSLSYEIYKRLPNNTDFTEFRRAGLAGLNFAYLNGATHIIAAWTISPPRTSVVFNIRVHTRWRWRISLAMTRKI